MLPPLIPRRALLAAAVRLKPTLSPRGDALAYLAPADGVLSVWVGAADGTGARPVTHDADVLDFAWGPDGRELLVPRDADGDEDLHLYAVATATGRIRDLTPFDAVQARLLAVDPAEPGAVLVGMNRRHRRRHDAYRLDLGSGELSLVAENRDFAGWIAAGLRVRGAVARRPDGGVTMVRREHDDAEWRPVYQVPAGDSPALRPIGIAADDRLHLISSVDAETGRLIAVDPGGRVEVGFADPEYDVAAAVSHPVTRLPQFAVVQRERADLEPLDCAVAGDLARLAEQTAGAGPADLSVLSRDRRDSTWIVQSNVADGPAAYWRYDRGAGLVHRLFDHTDELAGHRLARMEPFSYRARDGLLIHGYLSFPPGVPRRLLPTVLLVHGGPWARVVWGFRAEPQWLANRGYLVAEVNYRGSTGYGKRFTNAGNREWGGRMQDDLLDAVDWLVGREFADARRIGVYGTSYGGYAALAGVAFTPGTFRCAVSVNGPVDLVSFTADFPSRAGTGRIRERIGDPYADADLLRGRSPLSRVAEIRDPVFIACGGNDPRVRRGQYESMVRAMREHGVPHEAFVATDEGHGFTKPANRLAFYAAVERFLAVHLGGRYEE
jgi:dipeptidyl aminopeptidase/acylaminoacyl peptidase